MYRVIAHYSHYIKCLLYPDGETLLYEICDVFVDLLAAGLPQLLAEFLHAKPEDRCRCSRALIDDAGSFPVVLLDFGFQIRIRRRNGCYIRVHHFVVMPDRVLLTTCTGGEFKLLGYDVTHTSARHVSIDVYLNPILSRVCSTKRAIVCRRPWSRLYGARSLRHHTSPCATRTAPADSSAAQLLQYTQTNADERVFKQIGGLGVGVASRRPGPGTWHTACGPAGLARRRTRRTAPRRSTVRGEPCG